jgi:proteasome accessory factor B
MTDAAERLINLALFLAASRGFVTAEQVRAEVDGYPASQDESAFLRMFERDKDELRSAGLDIVSDAEGRYRLDAEGTFASSVPLTATETASLRLVAAAFADDPTFPFADDLRLALVKLATDADTPDAATIASLAEDVVADQGEHVAQLDAAASAVKCVEFDYVNAQGEHKHHTVEPYGQFVRDGLWYLVARDTDLAEIRVYSVARISALEVNAARPKSPDFSVPEDFEIAHFIGLPFQYGAEEGTAIVRFGRVEGAGLRERERLDRGRRRRIRPLERPISQWSGRESLGGREWARPDDRRTGVPGWRAGARAADGGARTCLRRLQPCGPGACSPSCISYSPERRCRSRRSPSDSASRPARWQRT